MSERDANAEVAEEWVRCRHEWESVPGWGVIIGLSKCKRCGRVAKAIDFPCTQKKPFGPPP